mmetsp:Transcript_22758/g.38515  ORF Transcript_22758/g.38515 Transcript_22758/m.38515 type:complete len:148 (-) Transcript_22758:1150-1593(-)
MFNILLVQLLPVPLRQGEVAAEGPISHPDLPQQHRRITSLLPQRLEHLQHDSRDLELLVEEATIQLSVPLTDLQAEEGALEKVLKVLQVASEEEHMLQQHPTALMLFALGVKWQVTTLEAVQTSRNSDHSIAKFQLSHERFLTTYHL